MTVVTCVVIVVAVGALLAWSGSRKIVYKAETVAAGLHLLEVELDRRRDAVPDLVRAAVSAELDRDAINQLVGARSWSIAVRDQHYDLSRRAAAENGLSVALHEVSYAARCRPDLRGSWQFLRPATELDRLEERIAGAVRVYNTQAEALRRMAKWSRFTFTAVAAPELFVQTTAAVVADEQLTAAVDARRRARRPEAETARLAA